MLIYLFIYNTDFLIMDSKEVKLGEISITNKILFLNNYIKNIY